MSGGDEAMRRLVGHAVGAPQGLHGDIMAALAEHDAVVAKLRRTEAMRDAIDETLTDDIVRLRHAMLGMKAEIVAIDAIVRRHVIKRPVEDTTLSRVESVCDDGVATLQNAIEQTRRAEKAEAEVARLRGALDAAQSDDHAAADPEPCPVGAEHLAAWDGAETFSWLKTIAWLVRAEQRRRGGGT